MVEQVQHQHQGSIVQIDREMQTLAELEKHLRQIEKIWQKRIDGLAKEACRPGSVIEIQLTRRAVSGG